jgi:hypothetical protein
MRQRKESPARKNIDYMEHNVNNKDKHTIVYLTLRELTLWTDYTPDDRCSAEYLSIRAADEAVG